MTDVDPLAVLDQLEEDWTAVQRSPRGLYPRLDQHLEDALATILVRCGVPRDEAAQRITAARNAMGDPR